MGNLLYTPVPGVMVGGELQWGKREMFKDPYEGEGLKATVKSIRKRRRGRLSPGACFVSMKTSWVRSEAAVTGRTGTPMRAIKRRGPH